MEVSIMPKKLTYEDVKKYIESSGCVLISEEYINTVTPIKIKCSCGVVFDKAMKIIRNSGLCMCNSCVKAKQGKDSRISYEDIVQRVSVQGNKLLTTKQMYKTTKDKLKIMCEHGHVYYKYLSDFEKGIRCNVCSGLEKSRKSRRTYESAKNYTESIGYSLITTEDEYDTQWRNITVKCDKAHITKVSSSNFFIGKSRCPICYEERRGKASIIPYEKRKEFIESFGYELITSEDDFIDGQHPIKIKCNNVHIYETNIHSFISGNRCTVCNNSHGENYILSLLEKMEIEYKHQHRFDDCRNIRPLPFDFYLPNHNVCIEFDGRQHYEPIDAFGGVEEYKITKKRDEIKNNYCEDNNIKLIRIPYWNIKNAKEILIKNL
jgi:very-short-patch-repair endonuclease